MPELPYIDPEELPFTVDELYRAARVFLPEPDARKMADHLAETGPWLVAARQERRARWVAAGVRNAATLPLHGWVYPGELLPALASLSPETHARVRHLEAYLRQDGAA